TLLLSAPGLSAGGPGSLDPCLERYRQGQRLLAAGDLVLARAQFESVPADCILADYAAFFAAESLLRFGDEGVALDRFRAFVDRFPDSTLVPSAVLALADTSFRLGRWADAEREARRFLRRAPNHPEAGRILVRLAEARAAQGQVAEAIADLRRRWVEAPASPWGEVARDIADDLAAASGLTVLPLGAEERLLQAQRLIDASEYAAAARVLEELLALGPDLATRHPALVLLAPVLWRVGRGPDGIALLEAAVAEPPSASRASLLNELTRLYRRTGQTAAAVPVLERLVAEHPESPLVPDAWLALARARLELGQDEAARSAVQSLIQAFPDSAAAASAQWELGWHLYRAGRFREAAATFRQLSAAGSSFRLAGLYWSGRSLEAAGDKAAAEALYRDIVSRAPYTYYGIVAT